MQHWFSDQSLPCVISGSRHPGVQLPSVDLDYRAVCRHAGGLMLAKGHRHVAFLSLDSGLAGDRESEDGFLEGARSVRERGGEATVVRHNGTVGSICRQLDALLGRPARPTALLVAKPQHLLTVWGHLNLRGLRVPGDIALISRDDESFVQHLLPTVARYSASPAAMARKISRLVLGLVHGEPIQPRDHRLMPEFTPGESFGPGPRQ
jgi:DNA-binding LacI/PurR family transcriptional regulator